MTKEGRIRPIAIFWFVEKVLKLTLNLFSGALMVLFAAGFSSLVFLRLLLPGWPWRQGLLFSAFFFFCFFSATSNCSPYPPKASPGHFWFSPLKINCFHYISLWLHFAPCAFLCIMNTCLYIHLLLKTENWRPGTRSESLCAASVCNRASWT